MHDIDTVLHLAWADLLELLPYFFLAIFIGAAVDILCLDVVARRSFRKHGLLGILFTTTIGAFSPFCSFTIIPLIRKLLRGGVPLSAVMAFWIASPAMDPPIFALTAKQIGLPLATARLVGALVLSIGAGLVILALERRGKLTDVLRPDKEERPELIRAPGVAPGPVAAVVEDRATVPALVAPAAVGSRALVTVPAMATAGSAGLVTSLPAPSPAGTPVVGGTATPGPDSAGCGGGCEAAAADEDDNAPWWPAAKASLQTRRNWVLTARNIARDSVTLGKWLLFACIFEGAIRVFVPKSLVTETLGDRGLWAIPIAVLIAVPLYLNGIGAIPIVGGLLDKGMAHGAAISFLLGGAVTTIPAMVAVRSVVKDQVFVLYLVIGVVGSTAIGLVCQLIV
jgi:uncharacterized membrane protein YraQ (UPF0718 family)